MISAPTPTPAAPTVRAAATRRTAEAGTGRDAVGTADRLRREVADRIEQVLAATPAAQGSEVYVGWVAALDAAACPARYRASGADGWGFPGWSAALAGAAIGRAALARYLDAVRPSAALPSEPSCSPPLPAPLEAVRAWVRKAARAPGGGVASWVAELARAGDRVELAAAAANATRWMAGFVRVVGWPLPERLALVTEDVDSPFTRRWPRRWRPPGRGTITVAGSPDAVAGKVAPSGRFDLLVHRPSSPTDGALADRAAFEAAAGALGAGMVAEHVVITAGDSGDRARFVVDRPLLARGADLMVGAVRQRAMAGEAWTYDDATPSAACHHCPERSSCSPGQRWLAGPGRWRAGLPTL
jgi:hypothetical protein